MAFINSILIMIHTADKWYHIPRPGKYNLGHFDFVIMFSKVLIHYWMPTKRKNNVQRLSSYPSGAETWIYCAIKVNITALLSLFCRLLAPLGHQQPWYSETCL